MYSYRSVCRCVQVPLEDRKRESDLPELELQAIRSHLKWALGTEPRSSGKVTHALNHGAMSTASKNRVALGLGFYVRLFVFMILY